MRQRTVQRRHVPEQVIAQEIPESPALVAPQKRAQQRTVEQTVNRPFSGIVQQTTDVPTLSRRSTSSAAASTLEGGGVAWGRVFALFPDTKKVRSQSGTRVRTCPSNSRSSTVGAYDVEYVEYHERWWGGASGTRCGSGAAGGWLLMDVNGPTVRPD